MVRSLRLYQAPRQTSIFSILNSRLKKRFEISGLGAGEIDGCIHDETSARGTDVQKLFDLLDNLFRLTKS